MDRIPPSSEWQDKIWFIQTDSHFKESIKTFLPLNLIKIRSAKKVQFKIHAFWNIKNISSVIPKVLYNDSRISKVIIQFFIEWNEKDLVGKKKIKQEIRNAKVIPRFIDGLRWKVYSITWLGDRLTRKVHLIPRFGDEVRRKVHLITWYRNGLRKKVHLIPWLGYQVRRKVYVIPWLGNGLRKKVHLIPWLRNEMRRKVY